MIQTSALDCGPAVLKAMLGGFGIDVSYGRIREACRTSIDGTSIDTLEEILRSFGLYAVQTVMPKDHFVLPMAQALPAIVVLDSPSSGRHFIVIWRRVGPLLQIMDPAAGRRWVRASEALERLYSHRTRVAAERWRKWAGYFTAPLRARMRDCGLHAGAIDGLITSARSDPSWRGLAILDAATRMVASLLQTRVLDRATAGAVLGRIFDLVRGDLDAARRLIPAVYWTATPRHDGSSDELWISGVVIVTVKETPLPQASAPAGQAAPAPLPPELVAALQRTERPSLELLRLLRPGSLAAPVLLLAAMTLLGAGFLIQSLLLRRIFDLSRELRIGQQRLGASAALIVFLAVLLILDAPLVSEALRIGRDLELRLRVSFLRKVPRIEERYFSSRKSSDMAERAHAMHLLPSLPVLVEAVLRNGCLIVFTTIGIAWISPSSALPAVAIAALSITVPLAFQPALTEKDLRSRTQLGALSGYYLDAFLGLIPLRAHAAERNLRRGHEALLVQWILTGLDLLRSVLTMSFLQQALTSSLAVWLVLSHHATSDDPGATILLTYWALTLPELGVQISSALQRYPHIRNVTLRLLEPLGALERESPAAIPAAATEGSGDSSRRAVSLSFRAVDLEISGHLVLAEIDLDVPAGTHVAIVGRSGSGKSSLLGLLLGWYPPVRGRLLVDDLPITDPAFQLDRLRTETAWVDPAVQLWNDTLLSNMSYGMGRGIPSDLRRVIDGAALHAVLDRLPEGLQTFLGEGGALVSGGEGQRIRLARAMLRADARLALLDEPFRGLDREQRRQLLAAARQRWAGATLLCATHDLAETRDFDLVCVMENGRLVEKGSPRELEARSDSRYAALLRAEDEVRRSRWASAAWRRIRVENGRIREEERG